MAAAACGAFRNPKEGGTLLKTPERNPLGVQGLTVCSVDSADRVYKLTARTTKFGWLRVQKCCQARLLIVASDPVPLVVTCLPKLVDMLGVGILRLISENLQSEQQWCFMLLHHHHHRHHIPPNDFQTCAVFPLPA